MKVICSVHCMCVELPELTPGTWWVGSALCTEETWKPRVLPVNYIPGQSSLDSRFGGHSRRFSATEIESLAESCDADVVHLSCSLYEFSV